MDLHFAPRESGMMLAVVSRSKSKASFPSSRFSRRVGGQEGECNRASGGLMASRCKCSQSGTQATYPPTDALCQLTPYSLIILFSLLLSPSSPVSSPSACPLSHSRTLSRARLNYFINPLFPGSFSQPSRSQRTKTTGRS